VISTGRIFGLQLSAASACFARGSQRGSWAYRLRHEPNRELAAKNDESRELVQPSPDSWYIKALDMFGRSDSERSNRFCHWGLKKRSNSQARWEFKKEVDPIIQSMGLSVPDPIEGRKYL